MAGGQPPPTAVAAADALPAARVLAVLSEGCTDDAFFVGAIRAAMERGLPLVVVQATAETAGREHRGAVAGAGRARTHALVIHFRALALKKWLLRNGCFVMVAPSPVRGTNAAQPWRVAFQQFSCAVAIISDSYAS